MNIIRIFILFIAIAFPDFARSDQVYDVSSLAVKGDPQSQFMMGLWHDQGTLLALDKEKAAKWYFKAAEQGSAGAQNNLALLYANGSGVDRNYISAHMWANYALGNGIASANVLIDSIEKVMTTEQIETAQEMLKDKVNRAHP